MPNTTANGIQIEYDTFGEKSSPPLLLVMGLSAQLTDWDEDFCKQLAGKGLFVIRFDNRDVGLSTKFEDAGIPDLMAAMGGEDFQAPYSLDDMADDAMGLLDALNIEKAHICGVSMGAIITQVIGYRHPSRVLSLIPIMGTTGSRGLPQGKPEALEVIVTPAPKEREAYIEYSVMRWRIFWGSLDFDEETIRERAAVSYDRAFYPQGIARQYAAIITNGSRRRRLASITSPTLVIHGSEDPLLPVEHGKDTAEAIPNAEMLIIDGMGHCLPKVTWPQIVDAIANHTRKAAH
ncbi:alpha/beta fold hydrolase [Thermodesulfobacteriota bacterium]